MGISTYQSYCGAQIFDAVGLRSSFVDSTSPARTRRSRASACARSRARRSNAITAAFGDAPFSPTRSTSAASMPTASAAKPTCGARHRRRSAACRARPNSCRTKYRYVRQADQRPVRAADDHARHVPHPLGGSARPQAGADRGGRARGRHREAVLDRRHELRLDQRARRTRRSPSP